MSVLIGGLVLFLGAHSVSIFAPRLRERAVARLGLPVYKAIYGLAALAGLILIVSGYGGVRDLTPIVYASRPWMQAITEILMLPVFPLLLAAYLPGRIRTLTRNPMLVAVKLWATAHLLANGSVADLVLFGSFLVWAAADRVSLKRRTPRPVPALPAGAWNDLIVIVGGLVLYGLMLQGGHALLIGKPLAVRF